MAKAKKKAAKKSAKKTTGARKLVCPPTVKAGKKIRKVRSVSGHCEVTRNDGTKARVLKVERGHKGHGRYAKRGGKKK